MSVEAQELFEEIEKLMSAEPVYHTFSKKGSAQPSVELCFLIKVKDWQALKESKRVKL
jgi:hypothetical protein